MIRRVIAWLIVVAVCYGVYVWGVGFKNPLSMPTAVITPVLPASPVLTHLPPSPTGCGERCHD